jgi:hypothetical protein
MVRKKVTLSVDSKVYEEFREYCEKNAIMLSRKIEIWMEEFLLSTKKGRKETK